MENLEMVTNLGKLLLYFGVSKNNSMAVILMLQESEEMMEEMFLWIYDNHPSEEQIMRKAIEMSDKLTSEEDM